jgi:hypothetical protein
MGTCVKGVGRLDSAAVLGLPITFVIIISSPALARSTQSFSVPDNLALRIRLQDTLTSTEAQIGDPFSATVVDQGVYRNARVYGHNGAPESAAGIAARAAPPCWA